MKIAESVIEEIKNRLSIIDVVSSYIPVQKRGKDYWVVCPFHADKNPSMKLDRDRGSYYCFGCKESGNIFTFVMKMDNLTFVEAVKKLAERAGVRIEEESPEARRIQNEKEQIQKLYNDLNRVFVNTLLEQKTKESQIAMKYILNRGFQMDVIKEFSLGWAPSDSNFVRSFCVSNGVNDYIMSRSGLFSKKGYSYFQDRITFPIMNRSGNVVAFSARTLKNDDSTPKYINSGESLIFSKKHEFFGFYQSQNALKNKEIPLICEGNFDVLALHSAGVKTALATCGTALSNEQCTLLRRYNDKVKTFFDTDDAGQRATLKAIPMLKNAGLSPRVVIMPRSKAKDSAELLQKDGKEALQNVVNKSVNALSYALKVYSSTNDITTLSGKMKVLNALKPILESIPSSLEKSEAFSKVCSSLAIREEDAIKDYNKEIDKEDREREFREQYRNLKNDKPLKKTTIWETVDDNPLYETDLMKHLAFSRRTFCELPEIKRLKYSDFTNPKAAEIFSCLIEKAYVVDKDNDDEFLESIQDEDLKKYLSQTRYESAKFKEKTDDEKYEEVIQSISRIKRKRDQKNLNLMQRSFELGADTTMGVGIEALREKQNKERELKTLEERLRKGDI